jgi:hypothetical protein
MFDTWIALGRLNTVLLALGAKSLDFGWMLLAAGTVWMTWAHGPRKSDLRVLGLDCMPPTNEELRRAYRRAAKTAHPDAGGNVDAFRAVSEAFARLSESSGTRTA